MSLNISFRVKFFLAKIFGNFASRYGDSKQLYQSLKKNPPCPVLTDEYSHCNKKVLFLGFSTEYTKVEAVFFRLLESLGYEVTVLVQYNPYAKRIYRLFGVKNVLFPESYYQHKSLKIYSKESKKILGQCGRFKDLIDFQIDNIRVGEYAASSLMRAMRASSIDLKDRNTFEEAKRILQQSLRSIDMAKTLLNDVSPDLVVLNDFAYTPNGQIFDEALYNRRTKILTFNDSYNADLFIFRKYDQRRENIKLHPNSIADVDWDRIKKLEWDDAYWLELRSELKENYIYGDWYSCVGTQFSKVVYSKEELVSILKIDPSKNTSVLFSHIFWDASFSFGVDLFDSYYDWFVSVLKIAKRKTNINWIIKVHPANSTKAAREGYTGGHRELDSIREVFGSQIPEHIKILEPESDINTFSLFSIMDYCLTVRGTIGIESAAFGIRTLLAGTGRYDNKGFTFDYKTKQDYLDAVSNIERTPEMSQEMVRLARIHAYHLLKNRPLKLDKVNILYKKDLQATLQVSYDFSNFSEFESVNFFKEFQRYMLSDNQDYIKGRA